MRESMGLVPVVHKRLTRALLLLALLAPAAAAQVGICDRPISPWLLLGPFPTDTGVARLTGSRVGDESALAPTAGDVTAGKTWARVITDSAGRIDFRAALPGSDFDHTAAYAVTYVASPSPREVTLAVESDDDVLVWVNGTLVQRTEAARGVESATDTVRVSLAAGTNRIVYKVVNRGGGFGMGARLLAVSKDPIGDLAVATTPATNVASASAGPLLLGRVAVASRARLGANGLEVPVTVCASATRALGTRAAIESTTLDSVPRSPSPVTIALPWTELARRVLAGTPTISARIGADAKLRVALPLDASQLLSMLSRPIAAAHWDGADDPKTNALRTRPALAPLAGLSLDLVTSEFAPRGTILVNGTSRRADARGRVALCAPCGTTDAPGIAIRPNGARWWDPPSFEVRDAGWHEIHDGATWARALTGDSTLAVPDSAVATRLLRAALAPDKREYHAIVRAWMVRLAPVAARTRRDTIDIVGNSHIDAAWLWRWMETVDEVERTWGTATKLLAKYPSMHFAASAAQYYVWLERYDPELLHRIQTLEQQGRWNLVGGWWLEPDENMPTGESLVRQGLYGQRTFVRLFGHPARVAWTPDSFGYAWTLPQILRGAGLEYFVTQKLRWNDTDKWPASRNVFWWEGPDGSRVLTYIPYGYDHDLDPHALAQQLRATTDSSASRRMLVLYGVGDHGGGPTMEMLDRARELERLPTWPVMRDVAPDSSLAKMARDLRGPGAPVIRDELYFEYHRGVATTQAAIKHWNRTMESLLGAAEAAATLAPLPYPRDSLRGAWERTLFNQFHDILSGSGIAEIYKDAIDDYRSADSIATQVLERSARAIARPLDTRGDAQAEPYLVFNPSGTARSDIVTIPARAPLVFADSAGRALPSWFDSAGAHVSVADVPATGAVVIFARAGAARTAEDASTNVLRNGRLRVEIDTTTGDLARFTDERTGRELMTHGANALIMFADNPANWDAWNIDDLNGARTRVNRGVTVRAESIPGAPRAIVVTRSADSVRVVQRYLLRDDADHLDVETTIDWHPSHQLLKVAFPMAFQVDSTHAEIPYGAIARTTRPRTRADSARFETPMQRWVDASDGTVGVAIVNDGKYGYSASGDTVFVTLLRSPKWPDSTADMGVHRFTYRIVPHAGDWRAPAVRDAARSLNEPLRAVRVEQHPGRGRSASLLTVSGDGVELGALKRAEDDDRIVVRLVETAGRATVATVRLASPVHARETNLLERPVAGGWNGSGVVLRVPLRPWQIRTIALTR